MHSDFDLASSGVFLSLNRGIDRLTRLRSRILTPIITAECRGMANFHPRELG